LNEGCAKWCQFAEKCLGVNPEVHKDPQKGNARGRARKKQLKNK
jgi:hypothetical protein